MEKWQKIEKLINNFLNTVLGFLSKIAIKLTPKKIQSANQKSKKKSSSDSTSFKTRLLALQAKLTNWAIERKKGVEGIASNTQGHVLALVIKARNIKASSFKPHGLFLTVGALFTPLLTKVKTWALSLRPTTIALTTSAVAIFSLAGLQIYNNSKEIAKESGLTEPQELVEELEKAGALSRRPAAYGKSRQLFTVTNVNMPVYLGNAKELSSVILDFTVITTNRTVRNFLDENELIIRDRLTNSIHPTLPEFTLTTEGKDIMKQKIKDELNILIKELDKSGEYQDLISDEAFGIENVFVNSLLAN